MTEQDTTKGGTQNGSEQVRDRRAGKRPINEVPQGDDAVPHHGLVYPDPLRKFQRTSNTATSSNCNRHLFQVDNSFALPAPRLVEDTRTSLLGADMRDIMLDSTNAHRHNESNARLPSTSTGGVYVHHLNSTMNLYNLHPHHSATVALTSDVEFIQLPPPLSSKLLSNPSHESQRLKRGARPQGRPSFNMSLGTTTDVEAMQSPPSANLAANNGVTTANSSSRVDDLFMRVQRIVQGMRRRPPSANTVKAFPIVAHRYFPIVSAVLASIDALVDPTSIDGISWGFPGMEFNTIDRGEINIHDAELLSMMEHGVLLGAEGEEVTTNQGKGMVATDNKDTKAAPKKGTDVLKDLENLLSQVEQQRGIHTEQIEELSNEQRMFFDPELHSSSSEVLASLAQTTERYAALNAKVAHMVKSLKGELIKQQGGDANVKPNVDTQGTPSLPGGGGGHAQDAATITDNRQMTDSKTKIHRSTRRMVQAVNYKEEDLQGDERGDCDVQGNKKATSVLKGWLYENFLHPYPNGADKKRLAQSSGLSKGQVANWFINARVRLWRPLIFKLCEDDDMKQMENTMLGRPPGVARKVKVRAVPPPMKSAGAAAPSAKRQ